MSKKRFITKCCKDLPEGFFDGTIDEVIAKLTHFKKEHSQYDQIRIWEAINSHDGFERAEFWGASLETDSEYLERLELEETRKKEAIVAQVNKELKREQNDQREYERLKQKYEKPL